MSDKVFIFDTTLRDAEQAPGAALNILEKFQIARQLTRLNVDVIEAGFPISSAEDFDAVNRIAGEIEGPQICALSRALDGDIKTAWDAIKVSEKPRIHTFIGTSDIHIQMMRKTREEVFKMAVDAVGYARSLCETVEFSAMDATRTEPEYLYEVVEAAIDAGANIINIPDTVGYAMPKQFGNLIANIRQKVTNISQAILSVHCHDDLGVSVANSIAAIQGGARQVECAVNGLGERAGNAPLEEIVMAIKTRRGYFSNLYTDINTKKIYPTSQLVSRLMGIMVAPNKAIVGANAFAHSSGIHQDGIIKNRRTFEIMRPEDVGRTESRIILSPRSGRNALRYKLSKLGYELSQKELDKVYTKFLEIADKKKEVDEADLEAIMQDEIRLVPDTYVLEYIQVLSGTQTAPTATVGIKKNGKILEEAASGDGPVDALYRAIDRITGNKLALDDYKIDAIGHGKDAIGEVMVKVHDNGRMVIGYGASTDVIEASAKAYINAINKVLANRKKGEGKEKADES